MFEPVHDIVDSPLKMWKRKIHCLNFGDVVKMLNGNAGERPLEVSEVFFSETSDPAIGVSEGIASPYIRARYRLGENLSHEGPPSPYTSKPHVIIDSVPDAGRAARQ